MAEDKKTLNHLETGRGLEISINWSFYYQHAGHQEEECNSFLLPKRRSHCYYCTNRIVCVCVIQSHKPISMTTDYAINKCV